MDKLEELTSRVAIGELKARYFRAVDTKNWDAFEALFEEDATLAAIDDLPGIVLRGRTEIRAGVAKSLDGIATVHFGHTPEIRFDGVDQAQGIWSMEDELFFSEAASSTLAYLHGYGYYYERYRRSGGEWRFMSVELRRLRVDTRPR